MRGRPRGRVQSRLRFQVGVAESIDGILRRPIRSGLVVLGSMLGIGSFVAVIGLTATANSQVASTFDKQVATEVSVEHSPNQPLHRFGRRSQSSAERLHGVIAVGQYWTVSASLTRFDSLTEEVLPISTSDVRITAANSGFWQVARPTLTQGRVFDKALAKVPVAVIGQRVADNLGITNLGSRTYIYIAGQPFLVIGITQAAELEQVSALSVVIPSSYAAKSIQPPGAADQLVVQTAVGAGQAVAAELPLALSPVSPESFKATYPPPPRIVADAVSDQLRSLFLALAGVCIVIGVVGILNVNLFSVMERVSEIGLRMALGARVRHIVFQFLTESGVLGLYGGLLGGFAGEVTVIGVAVARDWTASINPILFIASGPAGLFVGLVSGAYPAWRASRVEPAEAFRR